MQVIMNNDSEVFIALLPSTDLLINNNGSKVVVYTADLMPQGGPIKWSYSKFFIFAVHFSELSSESKKLNLIFVLTVSASAILTCTGLITIGTCILCRKKSCSCFHKSKYVHINKEENRSSHFSFQSLSSLSHPNKRDSLLSDKQGEPATTSFWQ